MAAEVQREFGYALYLAQAGRKHEKAKTLKGFASAEIFVEMVTSGNGSAFQAVYTVKIAGRVHVLHCIQKKSKQDLATPKADKVLFRERLKEAKWRGSVTESSSARRN